jgi:hypothetical protein
MQSEEFGRAGSNDNVIGPVYFGWANSKVILQKLIQK